MFGVQNPIYYKYTISKVDIIIPDKETITVNYINLGGIIIEKDFDNDIHPIIELRLSLRPIDIYNILDNKNTVRFNVRLDKYGYIPDGSESYTYKEMSFNEVFALYLDDNSAQLDKEMYTFTQNIKQTETDISDMREVYNFFLFKEKDIESSRAMINTVISDATMTDTISYLLSSSGYNKVLMSPIDNHKRYNEIILSPVTTAQNINMLNRKYGFYMHGLLFFLDINRTYFIDKRGMNRVYSRGEYTDVIIYIYKSSNSLTMSGGFEKNNKTKTYGINIVTSAISMQTSSTIQNEVEGANMIVVDSVSNNIDTVSPNISHRGRLKSRVIDKHEMSDTDNEFITNEVNDKLTELDSIFEVSFTGIDMDILTPNKKFTFVFEDSVIQRSVGGVYRLAKIISTLTPSGEEFNIASHCTFYKIK